MDFGLVITWVEASGTVLAYVFAMRVVLRMVVKGRIHQ